MPSVRKVVVFPTGRRGTARTLARYPAPMSVTAQRPADPTGWVIWAWGVLGVLGILAQAVVRLTPRALGVFEHPLTPLQWALCAVWIVFMLYTEAWRGFHKQFSPRVVVRSLRVAEDRTPWLVLLAPLVAMGLLHGTRKRLIVSRTLLLGIVILVLVVRLLPEPWRAIVDAGVVLGLAAGALSIVWFAVRAGLGTVPPNPADFPGE